MENRRNYYRILHVERDAPEEIIRASYRTLMQRMRMHPDLGGDHAQAALINEAYAVLADAAARATYDDSLRQREAGTVAAMAAGAGAPDADPGGCLFCSKPHGMVSGVAPEDDCAHCGSPLYPIQHLDWEPVDQRGVQRIPRRHPLTFYSDWPQPPRFGRCQDISLTGMLFATAEAISPGALLKIEAAACVAVARVSNARETRRFLYVEHLVGVEFLSVRFSSLRGGFVSAQA
ncbi:MAG: J domain-containing protein [Gammaproteobacteria bacterium]